eukprot:1158326-Pelagomonas_calceolata.AAC.1
MELTWPKKSTEEKMMATRLTTLHTPWDTGLTRCRVLKANWKHTTEQGKESVSAAALALQSRLGLSTVAALNSSMLKGGSCGRRGSCERGQPDDDVPQLIRWQQVRHATSMGRIVEQPPISAHVQRVGSSLANGNAGYGANLGLSSNASITARQAPRPRSMREADKPAPS